MIWRRMLRMGHERSELCVMTDGWAQLPAALRRLGPRPRVVVVTHAALRRQFGNHLATAVRRAGGTAQWCLVPEGERAKSLVVVERLYHRWAAWGVDRRTICVALGGGVITDCAGFVAATYLRGLPWVAIPTTLVAQLDSAIGGKVGVNTAVGKNLVGAFSPARLVWADVSCLRSLRPAQWRDGFVEALKCGIIGDARLFAEVANGLATRPALSIVCRAIAVKARIVAADPFERTGVRRRLNLGHTIGHALEWLGEYRRWTHGEAVGIGLRIIARLSRQWGACSSATQQRVEAALDRLGIAATLPPYTVREWRRALAGEKKRDGERVQVVTIRRIGAVGTRELTRAALARAIVECQTV